ncbi:hypothetical protein CK203_052751 [Vitis vinifera]|uniref:Reverse transcriptase zinc-binding domain-containing protein n=1 Tax=Vitis vinifera TaxID=29760 RepID=A0A438FUV0_VITVI|nr:hypothetical protein CK203_052751 [Vitis vinifera]
MVFQRRLPWPTSDHFPVLLEGGDLRRGPSSFRFENMWLKVEGFKNMLRYWWQGMMVRGSASYRPAAQLKEMKHILRIWNREVFGRLECNKATALQQVEYWDLVERERGLMKEETICKKEAKKGYAKIKINGGWLSEEQEVREEVANAFQQLLRKFGWKADIGGLQLKQISQQEAELLELPFSESRSLNNTFLVLANRLKKVIGNGQFSVKKAYSLLASLVAAVFPKSNVWVDRVPTKIAFFVWEAAWGKVLTLDRLQKRGW